MPKTRVAIYNEKGRVGKTPLALELALRRGFNYATNQNRPREDIRRILPEGEFLQVSPNGQFPQLEAGFPVVFDLAGELVGYERSILSALTQSELIFVPVVNEADAITGTAYAIAELLTVKSITAEFVIVANMLRAKGDFEAIKDGVFARLGRSFPIFPVRFSKAFDHQMSEGRSIAALVERGGLYAWSFRSVSQELDALFSCLD